MLKPNRSTEAITLVGEFFPMKAENKGILESMFQTRSDQEDTERVVISVEQDETNERNEGH